MHHRLFLTAAFLSGLASCAGPSDSAQRAVVFFNADSAALDDGAATTIRGAAEMSRTNTAPIRVLGFAAPETGSVAFNRTLSEARAQNVMDALVAAGVPTSRVRMGARATVPFEQMPTESRRVEIVFGG